MNEWLKIKKEIKSFGRELKVKCDVVKFVERNENSFKRKFIVIRVYIKISKKKMKKINNNKSRERKFVGIFKIIEVFFIVFVYL